MKWARIQKNTYNTGNNNVAATVYLQNGKWYATVQTDERYIETNEGFDSKDEAQSYAESIISGLT